MIVAYYACPKCGLNSSEMLVVGNAEVEMIKAACWLHGNIFPKEVMHEVLMCPGCSKNYRWWNLEAKLGNIRNNVKVKDIG